MFLLAVGSLESGTIAGKVEGRVDLQIPPDTPKEWPLLGVLWGPEVLSYPRQYKTWYLQTIKCSTLVEVDGHILSICRSYQAMLTGADRLGLEVPYFTAEAHVLYFACPTQAKGLDDPVT